MISRYGESGEREVQERTELGFGDERRRRTYRNWAERSPKSPGQDDRFPFWLGLVE